MSEFVQYSLDKDLAIIQLDDGKANALGMDMIAALNVALDRVEKDAKAIIISGRAGVLSAGFDLKVMKSGPENTVKMVSSGAKLLARIMGLGMPVIIASSGHALAAGALLTLTGDFRIGVEGDFKYGLNETAIGMTMPNFGIDLAAHRMGAHHLSHTILMAEIYDPAGAMNIGYLDATCPPDQLMDQARSKAESLMALDLKAYKNTKRKLRQSTVDKILGELESDDLRIG
jgi:enoyl-CoA hydratase